MNNGRAGSDGSQGGEFVCDALSAKGAFGVVSDADHAAYVACLQASIKARKEAIQNHATAPLNSGPDGNCKSPLFF